MRGNEKTTAYLESKNMSAPMNILVLMCDHHRFDALGCLGNNSVHTPNLDRLAGQSVRFTQCYTQSPACSPARHSLATGRYPHAQGVITNNHMPFPGMKTIAHALKPLGYRRFNIGQMHWRDPDVDTGYEPWITFDAYNDSLSPEVRQRIDWESEDITRRTTAGPSPLKREDYSGDYVATKAIQQMREAVNNDEPFLCWAAFSEPHPPFYPPQDIYAKIDQEQITLPDQAPAGSAPPHDYILNLQKEWSHLTHNEARQMHAGYYGMVALVDEYIGRVLDELENLGIEENTLVVWTSDHGEQMWEHEMFLKFCMYEASVHVPLLMRIPGIEPGIRNEFVEHIDLFPTICDVLQTQTPNTVQGQSLTPLLHANNEVEDWRDAVFSQMGHIVMIRTKDWKLNTYEDQPGELYDLKNDPQEFNNLIDHPSHKQTIEDLYARIQIWKNKNKE